MAEIEPLISWTDIKTTRMKRAIESKQIHPTIEYDEHFCCGLSHWNRHL